jgi:hypothetical protein
VATPNPAFLVCPGVLIYGSASVGRGLEQRGTEHPHGDLVAFLKSQAVPLNIPWLLPCKTATSGQVRAHYTSFRLLLLLARSVRAWWR